MDKMKSRMQNRGVWMAQIDKGEEVVDVIITSILQFSFRITYYQTESSSGLSENYASHNRALSKVSSSILVITW